MKEMVAVSCQLSKVRSICSIENNPQNIVRQFTFASLKRNSQSWPVLNWQRWTRSREERPDLKNVSNGTVNECQI